MGGEIVPLARSGKIASKSFILSFTDEKTTALQQIMSMNNGLQLGRRKSGSFQDFGSIPNFYFSTKKNPTIVRFLVFKEIFVQEAPYNNCQVDTF